MPKSKTLQNRLHCTHVHVCEVAIGSKCTLARLHCNKRHFIQKTTAWNSSCGGWKRKKCICKMQSLKFRLATFVWKTSEQNEYKIVENIRCSSRSSNVYLFDFEIEVNRWSNINTHRDSSTVRIWKEWQRKMCQIQFIRVQLNFHNIEVNAAANAYVRSSVYPNTIII